MKRTIAIYARNAKITVSETTYTELTFNDFSILDTYIHTSSVTDGAYEKYNFYDLASLDNTSITGIVNLARTDGDRFVIGGTTWQGINVCTCEDGRLWICFVYGNGNMKSICYLTPDSAGLDTFEGKDTELKFTFDIFETSDGKADLKLGIYINGKLYEGKHMLATDLEAAQLTRTLFVWVKTGTFIMKSVEKTNDFSIYGFDSNWKKTLGLQ